MSTAELKKKLIDKIKDTEDKDVLQEAYQILNQDKKPVRYKLSPGQISAAREALTEIKKKERAFPMNRWIKKWMNG